MLTTMVTQKKWWSSTIGRHLIIIRLIISYCAYTNYIRDKLGARLLCYCNRLSLL